MPNTFWVSSRLNDLVIKTWDDGGVVFDDASGNLTALTASAASIFSLLLDGKQRSTSQLFEELLGEVPSIDDIQMMENVLMHFLSLNFVERTTA